MNKLIDNKIKIEDYNDDNINGIKISGFHESTIVKTTKKSAELSFSKAVNKVESRILKNSFISIKISDQKHLIKIQDLAESLQVSKQSIIIAKEQEFLPELIQFAMQAKHYNVPYQVFEKAYQEDNLDQLKYLIKVSDALDLPLSELLEAEKTGSLQKLMQQTYKIEEQCQNIFKKLDTLYGDEKGTFVTKSPDERITFTMTPIELNAIKSTIRVALRSLVKNPSSEDLEYIKPITDKHSVMIKSSKNSFEIVGFFGKFLGQGAVGVAAQRLNLLEGKWDTGKEAIIKIPTAGDIESEQLIQEVKILSLIHEKEILLGVQKPLKLVKDIFKGTARHCHLGAMYQSDLEKILPKQKLSSLEKKSIAYQLMYGLNHLHQINITHGDIKPGNIFFNSSQDSNSSNKDEKETRVFLADFGGAITYQKNDKIPLQQQVTALYRFDNDDKAAKTAYKNQDFKTYKEIQEKADIFAMCSVICSVCTGQVPYNTPIAQTYQIGDHLKEDLKQAGLHEKTIELLIKGLSANYQERPDASLLLDAIKKDLGPDIPKYES